MASEDHSVQDWSSLAKGNKLAITEPSNASYVAMVDTKMEDFLGGLGVG
ncbi:hypothetical protein [Pseudarthrobacter sp. YAF2]